MRTVLIFGALADRYFVPGLPPRAEPGVRQEVGSIAPDVALPASTYEYRDFTAGGRADAWSAAGFCTVLLGFVAVASRIFHRSITAVEVDLGQPLVASPELEMGLPRVQVPRDLPELQVQLPVMNFPPAQVRAPVAALSVMAPKPKQVAAPTHPAYELIDDAVVTEYGATMFRYRHTKSGAEVLSVAADDNNKVFGVTFRTPPEDSTGLPHILEHSVLCGSRNYPVKEPFVDLMRGSLQTFLNAFTYPDRTCYPVASQNTQDFYNLINVYLDSVLHPRAKKDPYVLSQEGWHYELDSVDDPLTYKGVVYNEMKGVYSQPESVLARATQQALFPTNTYGVDSGGDPDRIPELTFTDFQNFHNRYYHPSNGRFYFFGDDDPAKRLALLDEYLSEFNKVDPKSAIAVQKKDREPWRITEQFPASAADVEADKSHMLTINWLVTEEPLSPADSLAVSVLELLLLQNLASPLQKTLVECGLGSAVIGGGFEDELQQTTFSVGLKGLKSTDVDKVEELILTTLKKIAEEGFDSSSIAAAMNTIEFALREFNTGSFPRGLSLMLACMSEWIYDRNPVDGVSFEQPLSQLKKMVDERGGSVFTDLLRKLVVENGHRVTVEMVPNAELEVQMLESETSKLAAVKASLSSEDLEHIVAETTELRRQQAAEDSPEARASLPKLSLADLDTKVKTVPEEVTEMEHGLLMKHDLPSSGILYADVGFNVSAVPLEDHFYLDLLSNLLMLSGTETEDATTFLNRINTHTGGVSCSVTRAGLDRGEVVEAGNEVLGFLFFRGKAVTSKIDELFAIIEDAATSCVLPQSRAQEVLRQKRAGLESGLVGSGHVYAGMRLGAKMSGLGALSEQIGGLTCLETIKACQKTADEDWETLEAKLRSVLAAVINSDGIVVNLTGDADVLTAGEAAAKKLLPKLPANGAPAATIDLSAIEKLPPGDEGIVVPTQVNYVAMGGRMYQPGEPQPSAATGVVAKFLSTGHLWDTVRVLGGAYGGFCGVSRGSGSFTYSSYRDPNLLGTLKDYRASSSHLATVELEDKVETGVIGYVGDLDKPSSADAKGFGQMLRHLSGVTDERRQEARDQVLATNEADFRSFGERLEQAHKGMAVVVVGSSAAIEEANEGGANLKVIEAL
jgi:Zn-dependent M16 (insulinase) family peptidase